MATKKPNDGHFPQMVVEPKDEDRIVLEYGVVSKSNQQFLTAGCGERGKKAARDFAKNNSDFVPAKRLVHTAEELKETD